MMIDLRLAPLALVAALAAACTSPAQKPGAEVAEIAAMAPLKHKYSDVVMGFDVHPPSTLVVSVDLQGYNDTDDDTLGAMRRDALARWRAAWIAAHPHAHATLHVRFIDFIGGKVATESTTV
jgi:hypothetical protein